MYMARTNEEIQISSTFATRRRVERQRVTTAAIGFPPRTFRLIYNCIQSILYKYSTIVGQKFEECVGSRPVS